jgi:ribosome-binding protein aMBF1 (putative translation factor)
MNDGRRQMPDPAAAGSAAEPAAGSAVEPAVEPESTGGSANDAGASLPVMPGFREMALRRSADAQAARMAGERGRLVRELAEQRQAAGLSQTEVAARMGTSQSAVARLESGTADVRASTLERYAAAVGSEITWKLNHPGDPG